MLGAQLAKYSRGAIDAAITANTFFSMRVWLGLVAGVVRARGFDVLESCLHTRAEFAVNQSNLRPKFLGDAQRQPRRPDVLWRFLLATPV